VASVKNTDYVVPHKKEGEQVVCFQRECINIDKLDYLQYYSAFAVLLLTSEVNNFKIGKSETPTTRIITEMVAKVNLDKVKVSLLKFQHP